MFAESSGLLAIQPTMANEGGKDLGTGSDKVRGGLAATFSVLAGTKNEAATRVLLAALDVADREIHAATLEALLKRRSAAGHRELLRRWHTITDRSKSVVAEKAGQMTGALRDAVLSSDRQLATNGCRAAVHLREYDMIPALITAAEDKSNQCGPLAAGALLGLTESLCDELAKPRDYKNRRDPHVFRNHIVGALENSAGRFEQHKRREILEAFLLLTDRENPVLDQILRHPHDPAYATIVHLLSHSERPGVIRLLLSHLDDAHTPTSIGGVIARRRDLPFLRCFLKRFREEIPHAARSQLKRIDSFAWLRDMSLLSELDDDEQGGALHVAMASGMNRLRVFELVQLLLTRGTTGGRRVAAKTLAEFHGIEANGLIMKAIRDEDAIVQSFIAPLLRDRGIPGAMTTLLQLIDSPHAEVQAAVRKSLSEFSFERVITTFDMLDYQAQRETGRLTRLVDPKCIPRLREEFNSEVRMRRIRAVQMAVAMNVVVELEDEVISLLTDDDQVLRSEAAEALTQSDSQRSREALRDALLDRSPIVREAVEKTLQSFAEDGLPVLEPARQTAIKPAPIDPTSLDAHPGSAESIQ
jgi:hypothetical protein